MDHASPVRPTTAIATAEMSMILVTAPKSGGRIGAFSPAGLRVANSRQNEPLLLGRDRPPLLATPRLTMLYNMTIRSSTDFLLKLLLLSQLSKAVVPHNSKILALPLLSIHQPHLEGTAAGMANSCTVH